MNDLTKQIREDLLKRWDELKPRLSPREQKIIEMRFGLTDGLTSTLEECGKMFGVTRERIRQIEAKGLDQMRQLINETK